MILWIEITGYGDKKTLVNAGHVVCVKHCENRDMKSEIDLSDGQHLLARETYEQVMWQLSAEGRD
jgi:hypothetical protein